MKTKLILIIILTLIINRLSAQSDPQYSHYMFNNFAINPGAAGISGKINTTVINRNQWIGLKGAPKTNYFGVDALVKLFGMKTGVGLNIARDEVGFEKDFALNLSYAYYREIGVGKLAIGTQIGLLNKALDATWISFNDQGVNTNGEGDGSIPQKGQGDLSKVALDLGFGAFYRTPKFYIGLSSTHLNQAKFKFDNVEAPYMKRHYYLTSGFTLTGLFSQIDLQPSVLIKMGGPVLQYDLNMLGVYNKKFWGGVTYRLGDAIVGMAGLEMLNGIRLGIAYEVTTNKLRKVSKNSTEIFVNYSFDLGGGRTKQKYKTIRYQ